ncbi:MAG: hypothetical protein OCD01_05070 [Fibrobacterales bacterium]
MKNYLLLCFTIKCVLEGIKKVDRAGDVDFVSAQPARKVVDFVIPGSVAKGNL